MGIQLCDIRALMRAGCQEKKEEAQTKGEGTLNTLLNTKRHFA